MKKKIYLAILTLCIALTGAACGTEKDNKTAETKTAETKDSSSDKEKSAEKKTGDGTRLVSVKDVEKYIEIGQYKGLSLENVVENITDAEVEASIEQDLENNKVEVKEGVVEEGDTVTINYVGTKDGKAFDGGSAEGQELTVGAGGFIPGFEDGIVGMEKGETKEVPLTFPEDYMETSLAGKDVVFKITLQSFKRAPELDDEWVKKNTDHKTVEEYKEAKKAELQDFAKQMAEGNLLQSAWLKVLESSQVKEYPKKDIKEASKEFENEIKSYAKQGGMELEEYLKSQSVSQEDFETQCQNYAEAKVKQNLIIQGIMDAEGMTLEDEECLAIQDELIKTSGAKDLATLVDTYGQVSVDFAIGLLRVERFIVAEANVQEKISENGTVGVNADGSDSVNVEEESK